MKIALVIIGAAILLNGLLLYCCLRVGKDADETLRKLSPKQEPRDPSET